MVNGSVQIPVKFCRYQKICSLLCLVQLLKKLGWNSSQAPVKFTTKAILIFIGSLDIRVMPENTQTQTHVCKILKKKNPKNCKGVQCSFFFKMIFQKSEHFGLTYLEASSQTSHSSGTYLIFLHSNTYKKASNSIFWYFHRRSQIVISAASFISKGLVATEYWCISGHLYIPKIYSSSPKQSSGIQ